MIEGLKVIAWITGESLSRLESGGNDSRGTVPVHVRKSVAAYRGLVLREDAECLLAERDARIAQLERERDEAIRDAQRLRWIAETQPDIDWISDPDNQIVVWAVSGHGYRGRTLGDAIDSAMKGGE